MILNYNINAPAEVRTRVSALATPNTDQSTPRGPILPALKAKI